MKNYLRIIKKFLSLMTFLTILPTGMEGDIKESAEGFFMVPLVGALVGLISGLPELLPGVNSLLKGALITSLLYALSGLMHLDGFADFIDTSSTGLTGSDALKILKEPWRGAKAISATVLIVLLTYTGVSILPEGLIGVCLVTILTVINYESLFLTATIAKPAPYEGLGKQFIIRSKSNTLRIANILLTALILIPSAFYGGLEVITAIITSLSMTALTIWYSLTKAYRILGFVNGDILGYELELSRSFSFIAIAVILGFCNEFLIN